MSQLLLTLQSSLEKIFLDQQTFQPAYTSGSALRGESFAFQAALRKDGWGTADYTCEVESALKEHITVFQVRSVPCGLAAYPDPRRHDDGYLSLKPGLFPDVLEPLDGPLTVSPFQTAALWVDVKVPQGWEAGEYPITLRLTGREETAEARFTLKVIPASLPEQKLLYTQWFHADCLADWYGVEVWSEEHWQIVENYLKAAADHGMNTVLTPVLTPALDTEIGTERPCVQLADIEREGSAYRFGFEKVRRFVETAQKSGMTHFEVSHLYSQWGAKAAPNIYAVENGEKKRIFGWETPADLAEYEDFLRQFLPAVSGFFRELGLEDRVFFHISDEPDVKDLEAYRKHQELVSSLIGGLPLADAMSDPEFYDKGLTSRSVASIDHIEPFLRRQVPELWAYNCCSQCVDVSNRFLAMPSCRNRIIGVQLYKFRIAGFLHWGYNFWYSQNSRHKIDPFRVTDGEGAFPGGDPFSVYPGRDGRPLASLRQKVFHHALQDMRALGLLEALGGKEAVERAVPGIASITFTHYPVSAGYLLDMREAVNREIEALQKGSV